MLSPETIPAAPCATHRQIENLIRLNDMYLSKLTELTGAAVKKDIIDPVSVHVTATKLTEVFSDLKTELKILQTIITHP